MHLLLRPWRRFFATPAVPSEHIEVHTRDGWQLALHRVSYPGATTPVLMVHALAANRHAFNFAGRSLADWLARQGFDCYVAELRGHGLSERRNLDWKFNDYLAFDLPALIDAVQAKSGQAQLSWIGHSLGGVALLAYGILHPDAPFDRGVALGSALDLRREESDFSALLKLEPLLRVLPAVPFGTLSHWLAPCLGHTEDPLSSFNFWLPNVEPEIVRRAHATLFHTIPASLLLSLAQLFEEPGLRTPDGFVFLEHAHEYRVPTRMLGASRDRQVSATAVARTGERIGADVRFYGREHGHREEYGHWDLLLGRHAFAEVWPDIARGLRD